MGAPDFRETNVADRYSDRAKPQGNSVPPLTLA
jgi:hypothetical protein